MPTIEAITALLDARDLAAFIGQKEDRWFDAKRSPAYDVTTPMGRFELAKDVSSFLNAEGGHIIVGLTTEDVPEEQTERVNGLELLAQASFNVAGIEGVLRDYLYPRIQGLGVRWVEDAAGQGLGVGVIAIPVMPHDRRLVLMTKVVDEASELRQIVFGFAVRTGSNSIPHTIDRVHQMCQDGRSTVAERLTRIETKLDSHLRSQNAEAAGQQAALADLAQNRVQRILADE